MSAALRVRGQVCQVCGKTGSKTIRVQVVDGVPAHKACRPKRQCTKRGCTADERTSGLCSPHYNKRYYTANSEAGRERARQWWAQNLEKGIARNQARDKAAMAAASRAWYQANRLRALATAHNTRAARMDVTGTVTAEQLLARLAYYGHRCYLCAGTPNGFDHVKPLSVGGLNLAANLRPVYGPCNSRKGITWKGVA